MSITSPPIVSPSAVPTGPARGRNVVPGITNAPQPTLQPNESAHALSMPRYFLFTALSFVISSYSVCGLPVKLLYLLKLLLHFAVSKFSCISGTKLLRHFGSKP